MSRAAENATRIRSESGARAPTTLLHLITRFTAHPLRITSQKSVEAAVVSAQAAMTRLSYPVMPWLNLSLQLIIEHTLV